MKKKALLILLIWVLFFACPLFARNALISQDNTPPPPRMLYPIYDTVTLTGNAPLEFRWMNDYVWTDHFIFRLYKGYNTYGQDLIYKQDIPPGDSSVSVKSGLFQDGQVYTWTIIRVARGGEKSDKSFNSFKVIRKSVGSGQ